MLYKNVSGTHVQIQEHRFLQPNATIDLSEEELKAPNIRNMISQKGWLAPILQEVATGLITSEVGRIAGQHPGNSSNVTNYNFSVNIPVGHEATQADLDRQKIIDAAIEDGKAHKLSTNLPLENQAEVDFVSEGAPVDGTKEYGDSESNQYNEPITHNGMITPMVYGEHPTSIKEAMDDIHTALPAVEQYIPEDNKVHAAVTDDVDYSEKAVDDKPVPEKPHVDKPANSKKPTTKKKD